MERLALVICSVSATGAYLVALREFYAWWVVVPVAFIALPISMILSALALQFAGMPIGRLIFLALGSGLVWIAVTEDQRVGSAFMGAAFLVLGTSARTPERTT